MISIDWVCPFLSLFPLFYLIGLSLYTVLLFEWLEKFIHVRWLGIRINYSGVVRFPPIPREPRSSKLIKDKVIIWETFRDSHALAKNLGIYSHNLQYYIIPNCCIKFISLHLIFGKRTKISLRSKLLSSK